MQHLRTGFSVPLSLDHHATTPVAPEVIDAMMPYFREEWSNAHSAHLGGERAARAVATARTAVADLIGVANTEIVFTSGATESNNIAVLGVARAALTALPSRRRVLTTAIEHKCVLEAARSLKEFGFAHEIIPVTDAGMLDLAALDRMIDDNVLLVSVIAASNEIGTVQPLHAAGEIIGGAGAVFHVDAAQAAGRVPFDVAEIGCDLVSLSAHKLYGPKGIGALYVSSASPIRPSPIQFGGGQEQGLRSGTLPVPLIVGFGRAAELAMVRMADDDRHLRALGDRFLDVLRESGVEVRLNGISAPRLPGSLNIRVTGACAEEIIPRVTDRLLLSSGSACMSGELQGSYVLRAIGLGDTDVASSFRICFGRSQTLVDAENAAVILAEAVDSCKNAPGGDVQQHGGKYGDVHGAGVSAPICGP